MRLELFEACWNVHDLDRPYEQDDDDPYIFLPNKDEVDVVRWELVRCIEYTGLQVDIPHNWEFVGLPK